MKTILNTLYSKCKQYSNKLFYTCTNNNVVLHQSTLFGAIMGLNDHLFKNKVLQDGYRIIVISNNILFKSIVFLYCFFRGIDLFMISPKFEISEIMSAMLSKRGFNVLFADQSILYNIEKIEKEEMINIKGFYNYIETTEKLLGITLEVSKHKTSIPNKLLRTDKSITGLSTLSPGTSSRPSIINIPYSLLGKSSLVLSYFMGLNPSDKVSVIADFEFYPNIYTILGLLNGIHYTQITNFDDDLPSGEVLKELLVSNKEHKPNRIIISNNNFRKIWDSVITKVYSKFLFVFLSKYFITKWIVTKVINRELYKIFGKSVEKIHILNEELGFYVLDVLKKSKIQFSSSYGFLEEGNILSFKDPKLFKHNNFIYKPGGTVLMDNEKLFDKIFIDKNQEICINSRNYPFEFNTKIKSGDIGQFIPNEPEQGDRRYLYVYGRKFRIILDSNTKEKFNSLTLVERILKDTYLIRDCHLINLEDNKYQLLIEPREDILEIKNINSRKLDLTIENLIKLINSNSTIIITSYIIMPFNGMRNIIGKLQYYNL